MSRWFWIVKQLGRQLWLRATLLAIAGVLSALAAIVLGRFIPEGLPATIGADAVDGILQILASSMLAVTTFSLSVVVAAYAGAASTITPRATQLLMQDRSTQNMLATFVGSFLFSLVSLIALSMEVYGGQGRVVLLVVTIMVVVLIVVTLLRWIDHISGFGRFAQTADRIEKATTDALIERMRRPWLGGVALNADALELSASRIVLAEATGYVQHIDMEALSALAERHAFRLHLDVLPGTLVHPGRALCRLGLGPDAAGHDDEQGDRHDAVFAQHAQAIRAAFSIGNERSFDQDPRFGFSVLAEIASRALSPAVNDAGSAIDILGRGLRVLCHWRSPSDALSQEPPRFPAIAVPSVTTDELFDDFFRPIARDGAGQIAVQIRLQKTLLALAQMDRSRFAAASLRHSRQALALGEAALVLDDDKYLIRTLAAQVVEQARS